MLSLILGAMLCFFYDIFRALRKVGFNSFWSVFFTDVFFWIVSAFITFVFLMAKTNGEIRGYILLGELVGFIVCRLTLSKFVFLILYFVFKKVYRLYWFINTIFMRFYIKTESVFAKNAVNLLKKSGAVCNSVKKLLKNSLKLLYTNNDNIDVESVVDESKTSTESKTTTAKKNET